MKKGLFSFLLFMFFCSIDPYGSVFANANDDSIEQATTINLNETYSGVLDTDSDINFYKFTTTSNGKVNISMANKPNKGWNYQLFDDTGKSFDWYQSTDYSELAKGNTESGIGLPAGTYYLRVSRTSYYVEGIPYSLQVKFTAGEFFEKEFNNDLLSASSLVLNKQYEAHLQYDSDVDFYKFDLPSSGKVTISMVNKSKIGWNYQLYDDTGKSFEWYQSTDYSELAKGNTESGIGLPAGTYYLRVSKTTYNVEGIPYSLQVKFTAGEFFEKEFNNDLSSASPLVLNKQYEAHLQYNSDVDFYKFNLPSSAKVAISMINKSNIGWNYQLYDSTGKSFDWYQSTDYSNLSKGSTQSIASLPAGEYYLRISYATSNVDGVPYYFKVSAASNSLNLKQILISNGKGANDSVTINKLKKGDVIKVYDSKGKLLVTSIAVVSGQNSVKIKLPQIGAGTGQLKISITNTGLLESTAIIVPFDKEK
ncbi:hypothetical protein HGO21_03240 [Acinetobacter sp. CUI P1]|nr:hypothetical protein [Acinetobacter sp. CUI P1]